MEAMLNGLTPDPRAFIGQPPASLSACDVERPSLRILPDVSADLLGGNSSAIGRPADAYSPMSFFFNFSHNVLKGHGDRTRNSSG